MTDITEAPLRHANRLTIGDDLLAVLRRIPGTSPFDVMNVRMILEPQAAELAATQASKSALSEIREAHEAATKTVEMEPFEHWDAEFHRRIFASTRNELLTNLNAMVQLIRNQPPWVEFKRRSFSPERRLVYCGEHEDLLQALERRDARSAAEAMRVHLDSVGKNLFATGPLTWPSQKPAD
jgi:DNA-binding FadR family transcriptional regulator